MYFEFQDSSCYMKQSDPKPKSTPTKQATDREILELQIDAKLRAAIDGLRESNKTELERLGKEEHEPKYKRLLRNSGIIIALLVLSNLAAWIGVKERIKTEADRVINNKLIDPQLTNTLDNALSNRAVPFILQKVRPIETNVSELAARTGSLKTTIDVLSLDISNKQASLSSQQVTITNGCRED